VSQFETDDAYKIGWQSVVTNALVGVVSNIFVSDRAQTMVDGNYLVCAICSTLVCIGAFSSEERFKLTT
jgi:hypothetical protein